MYKVEAQFELEKKISSFSCFVGEVERTTVLCTVDGPFHLNTRQENLSSLTVDVKWRGKDPKEGKYYSRIIKSILDKFILKELDASKGICICLFITGVEKWSLVCSINAVLIGLINCGIPLGGMFYAVEENGTTFVFNGKEIIFHHFKGIQPVENLPSCPIELFDYTKEVINFCIREQHTL